MSTPGRIVDDLVMNNENDFQAKNIDTSFKKVIKRPVSQDNYSKSKHKYFNPKEEVLEQIKNNKLENYNEISHETFLNNLTNMKQKISTDNDT